jgi:hypothetical protein
MDAPHVGGWHRLTTVARRVEATVAIVVVGAPRPATSIPKPAQSPSLREGRWWAEREAALAGVLVQVTREHHRQLRQQTMQALATSTDCAVMDDAELAADVQRAEELEEDLFRRSELRSRVVELAAHARALPHHLARLFPSYPLLPRFAHPGNLLT